ncbi:MAG: PHP domain-containing protein [Caulobacteraceae bacterium]|nr:PHP domain-containing protein [Caulobacteraceae bacterium]
MSVYAELDAMTNFSFLEGGAHPFEMVDEAARLGLAALGVADRNTLAGVVRAHAAAKAARLPLLIGCRLTFRDGAELIVYPRDRAAYGRLCRLLSIGKSRIGGDAPVAPLPETPRDSNAPAGSVAFPSPLVGEGGARPHGGREDEGSRRPQPNAPILPVNAHPYPSVGNP